MHKMFNHLSCIGTTYTIVPEKKLSSISAHTQFRAVVIDALKNKSPND